MPYFSDEDDQEKDEEEEEEEQQEEVPVSKIAMEMIEKVQKSFWTSGA